MGIKHYCICFILVTFNIWPLSISATTIITKIVGGHPSAVNKWPWMVALVHNNAFDNYQGQFCGGSLINPSWIVTAAHCLINETPKNIRVVYQAVNLKNDPGQTLTLKRIVIHPQFNNITWINDIALLQLEKPINLLNTLALVSGNSPLVKVKAAIIGWGALSESDSKKSIYPEDLYDATLPIISNTLCQSAYKNDKIHKVIDSMLCAGFSDASTDTCTGDSGGPLVIQQNKQWHLAGIASWGSGCAEPGFYGVYTRISKYVGYLNTTMKTNFTALADVNGDKTVNTLDKIKKTSELKTAFQNWVNQCWTTKAHCSDINADGAITTTDYAQKNKQVSLDLKYWVDVYWLPEIQR